MRESLERALVRASSHPVTSRLAGRLADLRLPRPLLGRAIALYCRVFGVDESEAAEPFSAHATFNSFFTRRLRDGARPVDTGQGVLVAPCDGRLHSSGPVAADGLIEQVKGRTYSLEALLGSSEDAQRFRGGVTATLYLSPAMYHRVHAPMAAEVKAWRYVPGRLYPVNGMGVRHVDGLFAKNERVVVLLDSDEVGPVAVVLVGAANVGRMSLAFTDLVTNTGGAAGYFLPPHPIHLGRGDELGAFNLGSTVVLLAANPRLTNAGLLPGDLVRMGQAFWRVG
jgi:phosphatidylserine decarboxylase